jgi:hypothetical protein
MIIIKTPYKHFQTIVTRVTLLCVLSSNEMLLRITDVLKIFRIEK